MKKTADVCEIPVESDGAVTKEPKNLMVEVAIFEEWVMPHYDYLPVRRALAMGLDTSKAKIVEMSPEELKKLGGKRIYCDEYQDMLATRFAK